MLSCPCDHKVFIHSRHSQARVDICPNFFPEKSLLVWDRNIDNSIKQAAREQRGHGTRTKVSAQTKMPKKWSEFLRVSQNKQELFSFLTKAITNMETAEEKILCATSGK